MTPVILALGGLTDEAELVRRAGASGLSVVRRCVDGIDLLAAAATDAQPSIVVSSGLPRLTSDLVSRLGDRLIIGLAADALGRERLLRMGIDPIIDVAPSPEVTMQQVADVCRNGPLRSIPVGLVPSADSPAEAGRGRPTGHDAHGAPHEQRSGGDEAHDRTQGRLLAVWGPQGAPGRTTVALGMAEALARTGSRVCLVDGDTYGPSITMALGLVESSSGLAAACRQAESGALTAVGAASLTMEASPSLRVLGGIERAARWSEVRPAAVDRLWPVLRQAFDVIVVDTGFCLEIDAAPGAWGRQRNAIATSAVEHADHLIAVADASDLGAARLIEALSAWVDAGRPEMTDGAGRPEMTIVRNRVTRGSQDWRRAIASRWQHIPQHDLPSDPRAVRSAWDQARSLHTGGRRSALSRAVTELAIRVA